jgi:hypothetical protein
MKRLEGMFSPASFCAESINWSSSLDIPHDQPQSDNRILDYSYRLERESSQLIALHCILKLV